jgi:diamine N-acetyltransferase
MPSTITNNNVSVTLHPVTSDNWRDVAALEVNESQREFVADPLRYLALCNYGKEWNPLAINLGEDVIGFLMWAIDPADGSCWVGGILIDHHHQGQGFGRQAVQVAIKLLAEEQEIQRFALSYQPANVAARHLYASLGFIEGDEWEDNEIVARLKQREGCET